MKKRVTDKYSEAITYLRKHPCKIDDAWQHPWSANGGCLFVYCGGGCLTQIKCGDDESYSSVLTKRIRADKRIPLSKHAITISSLPVFAEWQRKLDKSVHRK